MKSLATTAGVLILLLAAMPALAQTTHTVTVAGMDPDTPGTLANLVANASDGDTIVFDGDYTYQDTWTSTLTIPLGVGLTIDAGTNTVLVDNANATANFNAINVLADNTTIKGIDFNKHGAYAIGVFGADNVTLEDCSWTNPNLGAAFPFASFVYVRVDARNADRRDVKNFTMRNCYGDGGDADVNLMPVIRSQVYTTPAPDPATPNFANFVIEDCEFYNTDAVWSAPPEGDYDAQAYADAGAWNLDGLTVTGSYFTNRGVGALPTLYLPTNVRNVTIQGNTFGMQQDGTQPAVDQIWGYMLVGAYATENVTIGGTGAGEANTVIDFRRGFLVYDLADFDGHANNIKVRANSIHGCFDSDPDRGAGTGAPLYDYPLEIVTDGTDGTETPNVPATPVVTGIAYNSATDVDISGTGQAGAEVDVFVDSFEAGRSPQMETYLGSTTVAGDGSWTFNAASDMSGHIGDWITATQTDVTDTGKAAMGNTSSLETHTVLRLSDDPADSDGDGMSDEFENAGGLDDMNAFGDDGADADPDEDGFTNGEEAAHGLDGTISLPLDATSTPDNPTPYDPPVLPVAGIAGLAALAGALALGFRRMRK